MPVKLDFLYRNAIEIVKLRFWKFNETVRAPAQRRALPHRQAGSGARMPQGLPADTERRGSAGLLPQRRADRGVELRRVGDRPTQDVHFLNLAGMV